MLEVKNVSAGYGQHQVLHHVSLTIEKGKLTGIIGPNACGKSTLLKTMVGILPCTEGTIYLDGSDTAQLARGEMARRIAYLPQSKNIPDMTVGQMVLHGRFPHLNYPRRYRRHDHEIAAAAMARMELSELAHHPLVALSGGIRQKAYIAMALAQDTDYILLDEPTTYLDVSHQLTLMKLLCSLTNEGRGIATVMHDLPLALTYSDVIVVMKDGAVVLQDSPREVYRSGIIKQIFGVSLRVEDDCYYYDLKQ